MRSQRCHQLGSALEAAEVEPEAAEESVAAGNCCLFCVEMSFGSQEEAAGTAEIAVEIAGIVDFASAVADTAVVVADIVDSSSVVVDTADLVAGIAVVVVDIADFVAEIVGFVADIVVIVGIADSASEIAGTVAAVVEIAVEALVHSLSRVRRQFDSAAGIADLGAVEFAVFAEFAGFAVLAEFAVFEVMSWIYAFGMVRSWRMQPILPLERYYCY